MVCRSPTPAAVTRRTIEAILAVISLAFSSVHMRENGATGMWFYCFVAGLSLGHIILTLVAEATAAYAVPLVVDILLAGLWFGGGIVTFTSPTSRWTPALFALSFAQFISYIVDVISGAIGLSCC